MRDTQPYNLNAFYSVALKLAKRNRNDKWQPNGDVYIMSPAFNESESVSTVTWYTPIEITNK